MTKEFNSSVLKGGDVIRPETLVISDNAIFWRKRNKNLFSVTEVTISFDEIASISHNNKLIGSDLTIRSKGGDDIEARGFSTDDVKQIISIINGSKKIEERLIQPEFAAEPHYGVFLSENCYKAKLKQVNEDKSCVFEILDFGQDVIIPKENLGQVIAYLDDTTWNYKHLKDIWYDDLIGISFYKVGSGNFAYEISLGMESVKKTKSGIPSYEEAVRDAFADAESTRELLLNTNPEVYNNIPQRVTFISDNYIGEAVVINEAEPTTTAPVDKDKEKSLQKSQREKEIASKEKEIEKQKAAGERDRQKQQVAAEKEKFKAQHDKALADIKSKRLDAIDKVQEKKAKELEVLKDKYAEDKDKILAQRQEKMQSTPAEGHDRVKDSFEVILTTREEKFKTDKEKISQKYSLEQDKVNKQFDKQEEEVNKWLEKKKEFLDKINPVNVAKDVAQGAKDEVTTTAKNLDPFANLTR